MFVIKTLLITEKPSVAIDISKALSESFAKGNGYFEGQTLILTWAMGHLIELADPEDYDPVLVKWDMNTLPILPEAFRLKPRPATKRQLETIRNLLKRDDVSRIINACDAGREGESIFRYIMQYLNCSKPHARLWLSENTVKAINSAFANLRSSSDVENLARAAITRSQADWIVGINATRGYTVHHGEKMTVGRVQTPTLALIVNREKEIGDFTPTSFWEIVADFKSGEQVYQGKWFKGDQDRFLNRPDAEAILSELKPGTMAVVSKVEKKEKTEPPPRLFNLNDLQKEANKKWGLTAEQTLTIAQRLYEAHLLTYPRTDSRYLTKAMAETLPARLNALRRTELGALAASINEVMPGPRYVDDSKVTDHTAIIVTETSPNWAALSDNERRIYLAVARRMVGIFLPGYRFMQVEVNTLVQEHCFLSKGKVVLEEGWRLLYRKDEEPDPVLPNLKPEQMVLFENAVILDKQTKAPGRYTEADLLSAMENAGRIIDNEELRDAMQGKGLGTPATRAATIEKLIDVGYIERREKALVPTDKGIQLINIVSIELKHPEMTGEWEQRLLEIEQGRYHSKLFLDGIKDLIYGIIGEIKKQKPLEREHSRDVVGTCPLCGQPVVAYTKIYGCSARKEGCKFTIWKTIAGKRITVATARQIINTGRSSLIKGFISQKGKDFNAYLKLDNGSITFEFLPKHSVR